MNKKCLRFFSIFLLIINILVLLFPQELTNADSSDKNNNYIYQSGLANNDSIKASSDLTTVSSVETRAELTTVSSDNNSLNQPRNFAIFPYKQKLAVGKKEKLTVIFDPIDTSEKLVWKSSDPSIVKVNQKGKITVLDKGTAVISAYSKRTGITRHCTIEAYYAKQIALTFDDGPGKYTEKLLDFLKENNAKATFFVVGTNVDYYPNIVKRIKDEGHEVGSHTYNHPKLTSLSEKKIKKELTKVNKAIKAACGSKPTLLRPPYGAYNDTLKSITKLPIITWSVDPEDWKYRDTDYVKKTVINSAYDGAIILLHDIHETSVEGAIKAIKELKKKGYEFLTVTELIERNGEKIQAGTVYRQSK